MLKPQDLVIAIKLRLLEDSGEIPTFASLSSSLRISASEVHAAVKRGQESGLLVKRAGTVKMPRTSPRNLEEFIAHGVRYIWPTKPGAIHRGVPTATALLSISAELDVPPPSEPLVWMHPLGTIRGQSVEPLFPRAVEACLSDPALHHWLALIDVIRVRRGREYELARTAISGLLGVTR